jgi:hypothetical protein
MSEASSNNREEYIWSIKNGDLETITRYVDQVFKFFFSLSIYVSVDKRSDLSGPVQLDQSGPNRNCLLKLISIHVGIGPFSNTNFCVRIYEALNALKFCRTLKL